MAGAIELLLQWPEVGRERQDLRPEGIRSWSLPAFPNYLLFYRVRGESLTMLRVRYGGMNLPAMFPG